VHITGLLETTPLCKRICPFLFFEAAPFLADNFNGGAPSSAHSGGYISWPSLDSLIFMISKAASQAISGNPDGFGMKFYGSNTAFSVRPGVPPRELFWVLSGYVFSSLIEAQRRPQYRGGFAFVSLVGFGHKKRAGHLGGR